MHRAICYPLINLLYFCKVETLTHRKTDTGLTLTTQLGDLPDKLFLLVCDELRVLDHVTHKDWRGLAGMYFDIIIINLILIN